MALLFCDNFENWTSTSFDSPGPWIKTVRGISALAGTGNVVFNVNSFRPGIFQTLESGAANASVLLHYGFSSIGTVVANIRVAFDSTTTSGDRQILTLFDGATAQVSLTHKSNGKLAIFRGTTTAQLAESTDLFPFDANVFLDIELKVTIHNTTGVIELRVNGGTQIPSTGSLNTRVSANNQANEIGIGVSGAGSSRPLFKQFILMDTTGSTMNDFIGPVDITSLRPNADGEYDDWTANTGTRFAAVNQAVTDNDTTFVSSSTPGDQVTFQLSNLPSGVTDVFAVFPQMQIRREQGTTRICKFLMRSGIDDELGAKELAIGPTYAFRQEAITTSPFTTNAWDVAEVNGLELGVEITT
jgi:hypothetical protein